MDKKIWKKIWNTKISSFIKLGYFAAVFFYQLKKLLFLIFGVIFEEKMWNMIV